MEPYAIDVARSLRDRRALMARGFDDETSLLGERGLLIRNDIGWAMGHSGAELCVGADYGHVGGPPSR